MTVNDVICGALQLVGRDDAAEAISSAETLTDGQTRIKRAFLTYFNSVINELARGYFPLDEKEEVTFSDGKLYIPSLSRRAVKIKKVVSGGKKVRWQLYSGYILADVTEAEVYYEYAPEIYAETDEFSFPVYAVDDSLVEYGMAAEHFLVSGEPDLSRAWENRYRDEIEALIARSNLCGRIPPRRWI